MGDFFAKGKKPINGYAEQKDTGWKTVNANVRYRKINGVVYVEATSDSSGAGWSVLGTLPASVVPSKELITSVYVDTNNSVMLRIYTNGNVANVATASNITNIISYPLG